jgi:hypothetical protein
VAGMQPPADMPRRPNPMRAALDATRRLSMLHVLGSFAVAAAVGFALALVLDVAVGGDAPADEPRQLVQPPPAAPPEPTPTATPKAPDLRQVVGQLTFRTFTLTGAPARDAAKARKAADDVKAGKLGGVIVTRGPRATSRGGDDLDDVARALRPLSDLRLRERVLPPLIIFALEGDMSGEREFQCDNIFANAYLNLTSGLGGRSGRAGYAKRLATDAYKAGGNMLLATSFKDYRHGGSFGCMRRKDSPRMRAERGEFIHGLMSARPRVGLIALGVDPARASLYREEFGGYRPFVTIARDVMASPSRDNHVKAIRDGLRKEQALVAAIANDPKKVEDALAASVDLVLDQRGDGKDLLEYYREHPDQARQSCRRVVDYKKSLTPKWAGDDPCGAEAR